MTQTYQMHWPIHDPSTPFNAIIGSAETDLASALKDHKLQPLDTTVYHVSVRQLRLHLTATVQVAE